MNESVVGGMLARIRAVFSPPVRDQSLDEAIKSLNEARDSARNAARLLAENNQRQAREAEKMAGNLNRLSKRLWSI